MTAGKDATKPLRRRLGKGLGSLITAPVSVEPPRRGEDVPARGTEAPPTDQPLRVSVDDIQANPWQPRQHFDERSLDSLATSIKTTGVMQPIVVRPRLDGGYELVAGERRWRAARKAGLNRIPAIVRDIDDRQAAEWSLIENLQREDLNAIERAEAFRRLAEQFNLTHQAIAELVGLDRSSVTNHLRLLELDEPIQALLREGSLGLGQGRALLTVTNLKLRNDLAHKAVREGWTARTTEREANRVLRQAEGTGATPTAEPKSGRQAHLGDLDRRLSEHLGTRVRVLPARKKGTGKMVIEFYSGEQFEGLIDRLGFSLD